MLEHRAFLVAGAATAFGILSRNVTSLAGKTVVVIGGTYVTGTVLEITGGGKFAEPLKF